MIYACEGCEHGEHDIDCRWISNSPEPEPFQVPDTIRRTRRWHNTDGRLVKDDLGHNVTLWLIELGYDAWLGIDRIGGGIPALLKFANNPVPVPQPLETL